MVTKNVTEQILMEQRVVLGGIQAVPELVDVQPAF